MLERGHPDRIRVARAFREGARGNFGTRTIALHAILHAGVGGRLLWAFVPRCACGRRNGPRSHMDITDEALPRVCARCWETHPLAVNDRLDREARTKAAAEAQAAAEPAPFVATPTGGPKPRKGVFVPRV